MLPPDRVCVLEAISSPGFVQRVFELQRLGHIVAIVRPDSAADDRLSSARREEIGDRAAGWLTAGFTPEDSDAPAQIVFSSGTEGRPKAIVLSHRNIADVVRRLNSFMQVTPEIREYIGVPVTYSFGLGRARAVAAAGGAAYIPEKFNPAEIRRMLERGEINAISAVPSLWRLVLRSPELLQPVGHAVRWIEIGSQFMSAEEKIAMKRLFPQARIVQHYGLTEASRTTFLDIGGSPETALDSVGCCTGEVELRIDAEGAIAIRGPHVALGRIEDDGRIRPLADADGWLVTKDRGEVRDGNLHFLGRLDDQINISGVKISADQLEQGIAARVPGLDGSFAVAPVDDAMRGNAALLAVEEGAAASLPDLEAAARATLEHHGISGGENLRLLQVAALPRTGSGKVQRAALRERYLQESAGNEGNGPGPAPSLAGRLVTALGGRRSASVREVFARHFPRAPIASDTSFESLGGDSLSYLAVALDLEAILGDLPENWKDLPVSDLEGRRRVTGFVGRIDTPTFIRALAIILIVAGHFDAFEYGGTGAYTLFLVAGVNFAALTLPTVLQTGAVAPILVLLLRVALMCWLYITLNLVVTGYGGPLAYFMVSNWVDPHYDGGVWFVAVYIQILLVLALLLSVGSLRDALQRHIFTGLLAFALLTIAILAVSEQVYDANPLFRRLPHLLAWMFACGALGHVADTALRKALSFAVFCLGFLVFFGWEFNFMLLAVPVVLVIPSVPVPRLVMPLIRLTASASLLIYLSHFQFRTALEKTVGATPWLAVAVAVAGGVIAWMIYRPFDEMARGMLVRLFERKAPKRRGDVIG